MSELDRLVNACLLPGFGGTDVPRWVGPALDEGLAGLVIFPHSLHGPDAVRRLAHTLRELRRDALIAVDEEGGDVTRLHFDRGSPYPGNLALGVVDDLDLTRRVAAAIAADLIDAGVNYNLAPSLDVNSDPDNPVIGVRSFGDDPELVAAHGAAYVRTMHEAGVATAGKHLPGHGATGTDSHHELPVVDCDLSTFYRRELAPFVAAVEAGVPSLMVAHVIFPAVDPSWPATLSRTILHNLVRDQLGFEGVLLSTAPALAAMGATAAGAAAVGATAAMVTAAVRSLRAGADLLLIGPADGEESCAAIRAGVADAIRSGELDASTLAAAAARVDAMRAWAEPSLVRPGVVRTGAVRAPDRTAGLAAARRAVRVSGSVALPGQATIVELRAPAHVVVGEAYWSVADRLAELGLVARRVTIDADNPASEEIAVVAESDGPLVLVVRDAYQHPRQQAWVRKLLADRPDTVLVAVGMPEDATLTTGASICTLGAARANTQVAAELLAGGHSGRR